MVRTKKFLSVLLTIVMLLQTLVIPNFAADVSGFVDFPANSWSTAAMTAAVDNGLLVGTSDTTIEPSKNLTRAEFAAIISRAFGATKVADISHFADVGSDDWYYNAVAKAVQMGVMNGTSDTTFSPAAYMKREDVILSLARVLFVDGEDTSVLDQFSDKNSIDYWAYKAVAGMVSEGYVNGYEDGTIRPLNYITREELAQLFHNIFKTYVSVHGTYDYLPGNGSVVIRTPEVTLRNMTINGDLVMADGIGEGDLTLINVTVLGKIIARGGEGTVYFKGVESDGLVIINDPNGVVNFHNYRDEKPFVDNLLENTPATFLERGGAVAGGGSGFGGGSSSGGGVSGGGSGNKYSLYFYESLDDLNAEAEPVLKVTGKKSAYVVMPFDVPTDAEMEKAGFEFQGWSKKNSVEVKSRDYFIDKKISKVAGKWYAVYNLVEELDEYEITFSTPDGDVPVTKLEGEAIKEYEIPEIEVDESEEFIGWTTEEGSTTVEYTNDDLVDKTVDEIFGDLEVTLYPVIVDKDAYTVVFVGENTVTKYDPDYLLSETDVPEDPEKAKHTFKGWAEEADETDETKIFDRDYFVEKTVSEVAGTWYPIFERIPDEYEITFVTPDGNVPVTKTEGETIADSEIPEIEVDESKEFMGWTTEDGSTTVEYTNDQLTADVVENVFADLEVTLYPVIADKDAYNVVFVGANTVTKYDPDYVLEETDVPEDPEKADHTFKGWAKAADETDETKIFDRDYFVGKTVSEVEGTWNPIFEKNPDEYTIKFVTADEDEVLTKLEGETIEESEIPEIEVDESEEFMGWTTEAGSTTVEYTNDQLTADVVENVFADLEVTLYPVIADKDAYNVIFVGANTVTKYDPDYVLEETDVPEDPEKADHTFKGWAKAADETDETKIFDRDYFVGKTVSEVEGTWNPIFEKNPDEYTIKFVTADEDKVLTKLEGEKIEAAEIPEIEVDESEEFMGWTTEEGSTTVEYTNDQLTADVVENVFADTEVTLYPVVETKDAYNVIFVGANTVTKYDPAYVLADTDVPEDPEKADHTFKGWAKAADETDETKIFDRDYFVGKTVSEVAGTWNPIFEEIYVPAEYTITFAIDGEDTILTKTEGETIVSSEIPEIEVDESEEFKGWTLEEGSTNVDFTNDQLTADVVENVFADTEVTLYPVVETKDAYNVIFVGANTVTKYDPAYVLADTDVPEDPEKADHTFKGWAKAADETDETKIFDKDYFVGKTVSEVAGTWNPIFEEIYVPAEYTITFAIDGEDTILTKTEGETIVSSEIPEIEVDESEEFKGWTLEEGSTNVDFTNDQLTADVVENVFADTEVTLYPVVETKDAYNVIFVGANTVTKYDPAYVLADTDVPEDPEKADHTFKGWAKAADETDETKIFDRDYFVGKTVSEVAGTWNPIFELIVLPDEYTIQFVVDGADKFVTKLEGEKIEAAEIPAVTVDESEEFMGWTTEDGSTDVDYTNDDLTADVVENVLDDFDVVLYPVVADKTAYVVTFKLDGGDVVITKYNPDEIVAGDLIPEDPEKDNHTFKGWAEASDETDETKIYDRDYFVGKPVSEIDGTWYPIFEIIVLPDEYSITFVKPGLDKNIKKLEGETITAAEIPEITVDESEEFKGWSLVEGSTSVDFTNEQLTADVVENLFGTTDVVLYSVIVDKEYFEVVFVTESRDFEYGSYDPDYKLSDSEVPANPEKEDHTFEGWSTDINATEGEDRDYFLNNPISAIYGTWYPVFKPITYVTYKVEFKYTNGKEAIKPVEETLSDVEDYFLTGADVYDVDYFENPDDYKFLGWTTEVDGTDYIQSDELRTSIKDLYDTYYAQFESTNADYAVYFKYTNGTDAIKPVEETLNDVEDYFLTATDVYDVEHNEKPSDYKFLGWTTEVDGTDYIKSEDIVDKSLKAINGTTYYAQFEKITDNYFVYFKYTNGDEALETVEETLTPSEDYIITDTDVKDVDYFEEPYEKYVFLGWTTTVDGTDYIKSEDIVGKSIKDIDDTTYYAQFETLLTVNFYALGDPSKDAVDGFVETIYVEKNSLAVYPAYTPLYEWGYEKAYDEEYFDPDGLGFVRDEAYYVEDGLTHKLDYEWYCEDENGEFVRYNDEYVIETDLDVYSKIKKLDIEIELPKSLIDVDEVLIFNIPYEDDSRFLDLVRDALYFNADQITMKIDETGIEEKIYDKLTGVGESFFEDGGILTDEYEINKTDVLLRFFYLKQTKSEFADWLWDECEDSVIEALGPAGKAEYKNEIRPGRTAAQALKVLFEDMRSVYNPSADSIKSYEASKLFIHEVNEEEEFTVTADNGFITDKVAGEIAKIGSFYEALEYLAGDRIPEGLLNRLPVEEIIVPIYDDSIGAFNVQFEQAKADAIATGEPQMVTSGFRFNINLITEVMIPLMDWSKETHNNALDRVIASGNRIAQYAEKYYIDNPYAAGFDGGCAGFVNGYVVPELYFEDTDDDELYTIRPLSDIYMDVLMPLSVESTDALIWFTKNSDFSKLEEILMVPENKRVALHFVNHTNALMARYAEEGLPEDIIEYYNDLLEDEVIRDSVEKLNEVIEGKRDGFDMMYFVETKLNNQMAEMLYMKLLNRLGVPAEMLLSQYVNTPAYKEYTEEDYDDYVEQLGEIWADTYTADDGLDNIFDLGDGDDTVELAIKGFSATAKRSVANSMFEE